METIYGLNPIDLTVIILSLFGTIFLGWFVSSNNKNASEFLVGGRQLGWLLQFFLNFGNMADSNGAPTVSAEVYREGVGGAWINFQLLFSTPFYWFFPVWFRRTRQVTFADLFIDRFDDKKLAAVYALLSGIMVFGIIVMGNVISFKVASAMLLKPPSGWTSEERQSVTDFRDYEKLKLERGTSQWTELKKSRWELLDARFKRGELSSTISYLKPVPFYIIYCLIVGSYIVLGGLKAAAIIDAFQGILIIILSFMMIPMGLHAVGGFSGLHEKVDVAKFQLFGSETGSQYSIISILAIIFTSTVASIAGVNMGPAAASAKDEHALRLGTVMGGFVKRIVTIAWLFCGLLALALFPHEKGLSDPQNTWGAMAQTLLMPGLMGLMISGMILGHMPAVGVASVNLSALFTRNLYALAFPGRTEEHYLHISKICIPIVLALSIPASLVLTDFIAILSFLITFGAFMGTVGFMLYFWRKLTAQAIMVGMIVWLVLMCVIPWLLPEWSACSKNPELLKVGREERVSVMVPANEEDVVKGLAVKIGSMVRKTELLSAPPLFFDQISEGRGEGRFNVETFTLSRLGLPISHFNAADINACRWFFDGLFPALMLGGLSLLPLGGIGCSREKMYANKKAQKTRDDRFFVKMKTRVITDWEGDQRQLELRYLSPRSLDHLKLFPGSNWEFTKWTWDESVGFGVCWIICFAILALLWAVTTLGSN